MAYDKQKKQSSTDSLCLYGGLAQDFMRYQVGDTVKLTVTAIVQTVSMKDPDSVEGDATPTVEFEVLDVEGGRKSYDDMDAQEMETQIHNAKYEDNPQPDSPIQSMPNREDGGSIYHDIKRQEKIGRAPMRRPKPFRFG